MYQIKTYIHPTEEKHKLDSPSKFASRANNFSNDSKIFILNHLQNSGMKK